MTETASITDITLNGDVFAFQFHEVPSNPVYSYARLEVSPSLTMQTLYSKFGHFTAHSYGMGMCESYAFSVGANFADPLFVVDYPSPKDVSVFPNPGGNTLNIHTALPNARMEVYDINGRLIHSQALTQQVTAIDATDWAEGVYVWKVYTTGVSTLRESSGTAGSTTLAETGKWIKQ